MHTNIYIYAYARACTGTYTRLLLICSTASRYQCACWFGSAYPKRLLWQMIAILITKRSRGIKRICFLFPVLAERRSPRSRHSFLVYRMVECSTFTMATGLVWNSIWHSKFRWFDRRLRIWFYNEKRVYEFDDSRQVNKGGKIVFFCYDMLEEQTHGSGMGQDSRPTSRDKGRRASENVTREIEMT